MKYKDKNDIGERVIVIFARDVTDYLKELSKGTFINYFPEQFIDLLNDNYDECIKSVKYCPKIYFYLNDTFKRDKYLIKMTLYSYKRHRKNKYIKYDKKEKILKDKGLV